MQLNKKPHQDSHFLKFQPEDNIASNRLRITLLRVSSALQLPGPFSQNIIILVATSHGLLILTGVQSFEITIHADMLWPFSISNSTWTTDAFQRTLREIPGSQINLPSIKLYRQILLKPENRHTLAATWINTNFPRTATSKKSSGKAMPMFLYYLFFPKKLYSYHEPILQIFNLGILALKIGQT